VLFAFLWFPQARSRAMEAAARNAAQRARIADQIRDEAIGKTLRGNYISWHVEHGVTVGTEALHLEPMRLAVLAPTGSMRTPASPISRPAASTTVYRTPAKVIGPRPMTNLQPKRTPVPAPTRPMRGPARPISRPVASTMIYRAPPKAIGPRLLLNL
jgi:hypothetical protein